MVLSLLRKNWLSVIVPVIQKIVENGEEYYIVKQSNALKELFRVSRRSWLWWKNHDYPMKAPNDCFAFKVQHCRPVGEIKEIQPHIRQFVGIEEVGVGAHDHPANW